MNFIEAEKYVINIFWLHSRLEMYHSNWKYEDAEKWQNNFPTFNTDEVFQK